MSTEPVVPGEGRPFNPQHMRLPKMVRGEVWDYLAWLRSPRYQGGYDADAPDGELCQAADYIEKLEAAYGTERTMHNAWRKRAEEAEAREVAGPALPAPEPPRTLRNDSTPEGKKIWDAVDNAAKDAPRWARERLTGICEDCGETIPPNGHMCSVVKPCLTCGSVKWYWASRAETDTTVPARSCSECARGILDARSGAALPAEHAPPDDLDVKRLNDAILEYCNSRGVKYFPQLQALAGYLLRFGGIRGGPAPPLAGRPETASCSTSDCMLSAGHVGEHFIYQHDSLTLQRAVDRAKDAK